MIKPPLFQRKRSRGQSMVEFALTLPVLLLKIMGIVEFARIMHAFLAVQNAARFAARYASSGEYNIALLHCALHARWRRSGTWHILQ